MLGTYARKNLLLKVLTFANEGLASLHNLQYEKREISSGYQ
jgi:hypothetical protein